MALSIERREFIKRFGALSVGGLFLPETSGWFNNDGRVLSRVPGEDAYEAVFYAYGKLHFNGMDMYNMRKGNPEALMRAVNTETAAMRRDFLKWTHKPLQDAWLEPD
jgi:hypothetical protein